MTTEERTDEETIQTNGTNNGWSVTEHFGLTIAEGREIAHVLERVWNESHTLKEFIDNAGIAIAGLDTEPKRNLAYYMIGRKVESIEKFLRTEV